MQITSLPRLLYDRQAAVGFEHHCLDLLQISYSPRTRGKHDPSLSETLLADIVTQQLTTPEQEDRLAFEEAVQGATAHAKPSHYQLQAG